MNSPVYHNQTDHRFETIIDGSVAHVDYVANGQTMIITHTFVPPALRGKGIAGDLVKHVLEVAKKNGNLIDPQCSYVAKYIETHPEYTSLLA